MTTPDPVKKIGALTVVALLMATTIVSGMFVLTSEAQATDWKTMEHSLDPTSAYSNQTVKVTFKLTNNGDNTLTIDKATYEISWVNSTTSMTLTGDLSVEAGTTTNLTGSFVTPDVGPGAYGGYVNITGRSGLFDRSSTYEVPFSFIINKIPDLTVAVQASQASGAVPLDVTFNSTVSGGIGPYTYAWDAGDGSTASTSSFGHRYEKVGDYTASLTVTDSRGISATRNVSVSVKATTLAVSIHATSTNGISPLTTTLSATVTGGVGPYTYSWTTGDGGTSSSETFTYEYHEVGTYTIRLLVTDGAGKTARDLVTITVLTQANQTADPVADNTFEVGPVLMGYIFVFVVASVAVVGFMIYHNRTRFRR